jgi:Protein of unknown function (DUF1488)
MMRRAVRFWGHDGAMEMSFFVAADLLKRLQPNTQFNETSPLAALISTALFWRRPQSKSMRVGSRVHTIC